MEEPFYYLSTEDVVPRDAVYIVIGGSIRVVPIDAFECQLNFWRVEFQEGVEEIGRRAFAGCLFLARVDGASSLHTIGDEAFAGCDRLSDVNVVLREGLQRIGECAFDSCGLERISVPSSVVDFGEGAFRGCRRLSEVILREGLQRIGRHAFSCCALKRITVPSSVVDIGVLAFASCLSLSEVDLQEGLKRIGAYAFSGCGLERIAVPSSVEKIGNGAFSDCERLSEAILREGLRRIGQMAFHRCALRQITIPSSVEEIGDHAFDSCDDMEVVELAGGMVLVERGAFAHCPRLEWIAIPSMAIVIQVVEGGNALTEAVTGGIDARNQFPEQLILTSPHLVTMPPGDLRHLTGAIGQIAETPQAVDSLDLSDRDVSGRICDCFVDRLSTWYGGYKNEVAATLELGLWKIELGRARGTGWDRTTGGGKRARADEPTRDDSRRTCGADPIVGLVLSALAGPHRRTEQVENAGQIQP